MIPVILSGGFGSRLWPLSKRAFPKQFLPLITNNSLFQDTVLRMKKINISEPIIVCNEEHRFFIAGNLQQIDVKPREIILEPVGRNTAPAIVAAAFRALDSDPDAIILVLPSDHHITNDIALAKSFKIAENLAKQDYLVTFGIKPTTAHTGYGYIELGKSIENANIIKSFVEKPNEKAAEQMIKNEKYLWNSGMFCFKASRYLEEINKYHPELLIHAQNSYKNSKSDNDFLRLNENDFEKCENISIDYAVMENTKKGCVVQIDADWSDIGSWDSLWKISNKNENNNVNKGNILSHNTQNSYLHCTNKLLVTIGVDNLVIVDTPEAILVSNKSNAQEVKSIVDKLMSENNKKLSDSTQVYDMDKIKKTS